MEMAGRSRRLVSTLGPARLDLDGDVAEACDPVEPLLVDGRGLRPIGDDGDDGGAVPWADLPKMQVGNAVPVDLQALANEALRALIGHHIEQHPAGIADQSIGPARDHAGAD